ncbi:MAG: gamma-glutamyl-gamma-aminobutyrate hydrolase family protein [Rhodospirillaceae bacterium]|nr:gamma-glutamyl-gamma-aminobutyrate hydrolase family protein [Rhodospirillaceae bacterium]
MRDPVIGITADSEQPGGYSKFPWYAIRENYCSSVRQAGGVPIVLPHELSLVQHYVNMLDGLLVSGGNFDVDPALFGAATRHPKVTVKEGRTDFELAMTRAMLAADKPILGICGGQQLLAVAMGGTLIQHIPDEVGAPLAHEQPNPRDQAGHDVDIKQGTLLHRITGETRVPVNSAHHQAVKDVPGHLVIDAVAPDGVIEGIEDPSRKFCIGVQWHPEFHISPADVRLFAAFIDACRT